MSRDVLMRENLKTPTNKSSNNRTHFASKTKKDLHQSYDAARDHTIPLVTITRNTCPEGVRRRIQLNPNG